MDPSSNNSFGSFSSGGISGGNDFVGGEQPVDDGLNVTTNSAVTDNGGAATNNFGAQVPGASDADAGVFGATGIAPGAAVNASVGVGAASAPAPQAQPQMTQTQFSTQPQFPMRPQVVVSGTGDVVLGGVEPKKSKRGLIVVIVLCLMISVVGLVAYVFNRNTNRDTGSVQTLAGNYREAFNEYANYILYGKDSLNDIENSYQPDVFYAIWQAADEKDEAFFDKSKVLFGNITNQLQKQENSIDFIAFNDYANTFDFYYLYNTVPKISSADILEKYLQNGKEAVSEYINSSYEAFEESSDLAQSYGRGQKEIDLLTLDQIDIAHANGCIENGAINQSCFNSLEMKDISERKTSLTMSVNRVIYDASRDVVLDCFTIANEFYSSRKGQNAQQ